MRDITTIQVERSVVDALKKLKKYPRQTYSELIQSLIQLAEHVKIRNQYDEFLHKVQQTKIEELWDNEFDEDWEDA